MLLSWMPGFLNKQNVQLSSDVFAALQVMHHLCKKNMQNYIFFVYWGKAHCGFCRSLFYIYKVCLNCVIVFVLCMILLEETPILYEPACVLITFTDCLNWVKLTWNDCCVSEKWTTDTGDFGSPLSLYITNWHVQKWSSVIWYACRPGDANRRESVCHSTSNACGWRRSLLFLSPFMHIWVPWARQGLSHLHFLFVNVPSTLPPSVSSVVLPSRLRAEFW